MVIIKLMETAGSGDDLGASAMSVLCVTFGHEVSGRRIRLDPFTLLELGHCKRCEAAVVRRKGKWVEPAENDPPFSSQVLRGGHSVLHGASTPAKTHKVAS